MVCLMILLVILIVVYRCFMVLMMVVSEFSSSLTIVFSGQSLVYPTSPDFDA